MIEKTTSRHPIIRLWNAFGFSLAGLRAAWRNEQAFRQEVAVCVILVPLALWLTPDAVERVLLIGSWIVVILMELINSALEAVVDRFGGEIHELSGRAKDIGSAAVLVAMLLAGLTWGLIVLPGLI